MKNSLIFLFSVCVLKHFFVQARIIGSKGNKKLDGSFQPHEIFNCKKYEENSYLNSSCNVVHWGATAIQAQREFMRQSVNATQLNCFMHYPPADPSDQAIVSPNVDITYSTAWIDLSKGEANVSWPCNEERFFIVQMLDFYQNVLYAPGSGKQNYTGNVTLKYSNVNGEVLCSSGDNTCVQSPTSLVWIILRMQYNYSSNADDRIPNMEAREVFKINSTGNCTNSLQPEYRTNDAKYAEDDYVGYETQPWVNISQVWSEYPPWSSPEIQPYSKEGYPIKPVVNNDLINSAYEIGVTNNSFNPMLYEKALSKMSAGTNLIWRGFFTTLPRTQIGYQPSTNLNPCTRFNETSSGTFIRNIVAIGYIGQNCAQDAIYYGVYNNGTLQGTLTSENGVIWNASVPLNLPVKNGTQGYWSITVYNANNFTLVNNSLGKYGYSSQEAVPGPYGYSFILTNESISVPNANLLPTPSKGNFYLLIRTYGPQTTNPVSLPNVTEYVTI